MAGLEASLAEAEGVGPAPTGGKLLDLPLCFAARHGLGVAWARVADHARIWWPSGEQGEELAHDGIGGGRSAQAALEVAQGGRPGLALDGNRAQ